MAYVVKVDNKEFKVDIERSGNSFIVFLNGEKTNVEVTHEEGSQLMLIIGNRSYAIAMEADDQIVVNGETYSVEVVDEEIQRFLKASPDKLQKKELAIKGVMPGLVIEVNVEEGDTVKKEDGLLIVEAMKMQNEMKAPRDGVVKKVLIKKGQTVNSGDILVILA
ncbi:biotin/lipoyl-binding protein [candidate division WOR-3 bacterium]|nr:biotin/lipoyl-binding protein [candidate division WOR-3 bacterium]